MDLVWMALIGGVAAFPHCLGMCGGFALHLSTGQSKAAVLLRQLLWHAGRTTTYVFLGALAGFFGASVNLARWPATKDVPGYAAGGIMILMGLYVLGLIPSRRSDSSTDAQGPGVLSAVFGQFFQKPSPLSAMMLGVANGFLPCPITIGFLALAAGSGSVLMGLSIMAAMGLGTVWALLILGLTGHMIKMKWKRWGAVLVGVLLIMMGAWTILRKAKVLPPIPALHMSARQAAMSLSIAALAALLDARY